MIEAGHISQSIKDGSDAMFEFVCTPCGNDGSTEEAVHYCQQCKQYMCATCTKYHKRFPATAGHMLLDTKETKIQGIGNVSQICSAKCHAHLDRDIEMYCGTHDMVYCALCIAKDHRSCTDVSEVADIASSKLEISKFQLLVDDADDICKQVEMAKIKKNGNMKTIKGLKQSILEEIKDIHRKMLQHLNELEIKAEAELGDVYKRLETEIQTEYSVLEDMSSCLNKSKANLIAAKETNSVHLFVQEKLAAKCTTDAKSQLRTASFMSEKKMSFSSNNDLCGSFLKSESVGQVKTCFLVEDRKPRDQLTVKSKKTINISVPSDNQNYRISDICQLPDGTILVADQYNQKVKRLDHQYNVKDYCEFDAEVVNITYCAGSKAVAVKLKTNKIQFLDVGSHLRKAKTIKVEGGGNYGILSCGDEFWVSSGKGITICDGSGAIKKRIEKDKHGQNIFNSYTNNIATNNDETVIYVATWDSRIISFDRDGIVKKIVDDPCLVKTRGVTVSEDDILFVSGFTSKNIVMFSHDGSRLGELVKACEGLDSPFAICYDKRNSQLFVGCEGSKLTILELGV